MATDASASETAAERRRAALTTFIFSTFQRSLLKVDGR
jgi:hypothetical protein